VCLQAVVVKIGRLLVGLAIDVCAGHLIVRESQGLLATVEQLQAI
jgi:hypothetical protein